MCLGIILRFFFFKIYVSIFKNLTNHLIPQSYIYFKKKNSFNDNTAKRRPQYVLVTERRQNLCFKD